MKKTLFALLALLWMLPLQAQNPEREHRSVWISPWISEWNMTSSTDPTYMKGVISRNIGNMAAGGLNTIYYHCRAYCDASYNSKYEPWASVIAGTRGNQPKFDPFEYIVSEGHEKGLEVYAWLNPYRYCNEYQWGSNPLNYENSHPDWLIRYESDKIKQTILNPALPEVRQRIADIVLDILQKYDVDGVVFDDYFYTNGTALSVDAQWYNAYKAAGGNLSQYDWRRENVNQMIALVNKTIKAYKPWVAFIVGPAGVADNTDPQTEYGVPKCPAAGYQYNGIASDPIRWLATHTIDAISPQIYWPTTENFKELASWWSNVAKKFDRHCYPSTDLNNLSSSIKIQEYIDEADYVRSVSPKDKSGLVFFSYGQYINYMENYNKEGLKSFYTVFGKYAFPTKALQPLRHWMSNRNPQTITGLALNGTTLSWNALPNMRYTVYAVPQSVDINQFARQKEYLLAVRYTNSFTLPAEHANSRIAVCAYDRYGHEYAPAWIGVSTSSLAAPRIVSGTSVTALAALTWTSTGTHFVVEVAEDANFTNPVSFHETTDKQVAIPILGNFEHGKTYHWRVTASKPGSSEATAKSTFTIKPFVVTTPGDAATLTPKISWAEMAKGVTYNVQIATSDLFPAFIYNETTTQPQITLPDWTLAAYTQYYVRVIASDGSNSVTSETATFRTPEMSFTAPKFVCPASDGATLHSNFRITAEPQKGMVAYAIDISSTANFAARTYSSYKGWQLDELSNCKAYSKLVDGKTYYVRVRGEYANSAAKSNYTPYTTLSFVYNANAGVDNVSSDSADATISDATLHLGKAAHVVIVDAAGRTLFSETVAGGDLPLDFLPAGVYIVRAGDATLKYAR